MVRILLSKILSVLGLLLVSTSLANAAWTLTIEADEEYCFVIRTNHKRLITGNYEMLDRELSSEPMLVYIMEGEKVVWHSRLNSAFDTFHAVMTAGNKYWLCLQNSSQGPLSSHEHENSYEHPDGLARRVGFNFRIEADPTAQPILGQGMDEKTKDWIHISKGVKEKLQTYLDHFEYAKRREADHRSLLEEIFTSILKWTVLEGVAVILGALGQIFFYRRYLEKKTPAYY
ncbi:hypothetical protein FisN_7Hh342 [Fistulifera solaris]|uniref:GOLD domain-containing protein n=1 Tax=Fistulifera solaris TaxID=1519565 RepID=A0A1Z5KRY3_FISSO|nr:hypothetical protein FisN_7Hh342 [Fistulifera solaris]|eukprot:GAX29066.1 hypothetical protein FisN_7Hh342 [Fistulifera solaris]